MSSNWYRDIVEFHLEFQQHIGLYPRIPNENVQKLRRKIIREETNELLDALDDENLEKIADGLIDTVVVILGTCISYGIDFQPIWDEIHKTNMKKIGGSIRYDGKVLKPKNWKSPRVKELLEEQKGVR